MWLTELNLPPVTDSVTAIALYGLLIYILAAGIRQFIRLRFRTETSETPKARSLVPLGAAATALSFLGFFLRYKQTMEAIAAAGDISSSIVAQAFGNGAAYPILGLLCLALTFMFRYINQ